MNKLILHTAVIGLLVASCNGGEDEGKDSKSSSSTVDASVADAAEDSFDSPDEDFTLPNPIKIAHSFQNANLSYHAGLTVPTANAEKYTGQLNIQLMFGAYSSDLYYCVLEEQHVDARNYLEALHKMADKAGMAKVFENEDLMKSFSDSLSYPDVVIRVIHELSFITETYIEDNELQNQQSVNYAGAWLEAMYLGAHDAKPGDVEMSANVAMNMEFLHNILKGLNRIDESWPGLPEFIADLSNIHTKYNSFPSVQATANSGEDTALSDEEIAQLSQLITDLRNKIVTI